jgi:TRAP-type uncharacterized transport system fused permease subunit
VDWNVQTVIVTGVFAIIGTYCFVAAIEGYLEYELNIALRVVLLVAGLALVWPDMSLIVRVIATAVFFALFAYTSRGYKLSKAAA